jgi:hypothetical protein
MIENKGENVMNKKCSEPFSSIPARRIAPFSGTREQ